VVLAPEFGQHVGPLFEGIQGFLDVAPMEPLRDSIIVSMTALAASALSATWNRASSAWKVSRSISGASVAR
jgi:hypothetical protein